jgi:oligoribonuclease NrnB/cAMP/cGMP phosphodiesterase (DHH superfamily)
MKIIVYYHNDPDGIMSGAIVNGKFYEEETVLVPIDYSDDINSVVLKHSMGVHADHIFIVDFSFDEEIVERFLKPCLIKNNGVLHWIDHHESAKTKYKDMWNSKNIKGLRDTSQSGCMLTWKYLFPTSDIPFAVKLIQDIDLWEFKYDETKPFISGFMLNRPYPDSEFVLNLLFNEDTIYPTISLIEQGTILNKAQVNRVKSVIKNGKEINFHGYRTLAINCPVDDSMLGNYACEELGYEIGLVWRVKQDNVTVGLRCTSDDIKVNQIAEQYNGGGHIKASGFSIPLKDFIKQIYDVN